MKKKYRIWIEVEQFDDESNDTKNVHSFLVDEEYTVRQDAKEYAKKLRDLAEKRL